MSAQCTHTLTSGEPCNAPALNGTTFCRHHDPSRPHQPAQPRRHESEPLELPSLCDKSAVLFAVNRVIQALAERRIKCSEAGVLIAGLKLAARLMSEIQNEADICRTQNRDIESFLPEPAPHSQTADPAISTNNDIYEPTLDDLAEFAQTIENGTPDQLLQQYKSKQAAQAAQRDSQLIALAATGATGGSSSLQATDMTTHKD